MLRAPSARGPNSMRPWNQPTTFSVGEQPGDALEQRRRRSSRSYGAPRSRRGSASISSSDERGAEVGALHRVAARRPTRARLAELPVPDRAAPRRARRRRRRPPAGSRGRSNGPSRRSRPLPTQLSATPPARQRFSSPVSRCAVPRHAQHDLLGHLLDRAREVHLALRQLATPGSRGGPPNSSSNALVRHREAGEVVEVLQVRAGTSRPPSGRSARSRIRSTYFGSP